MIWLGAYGGLGKQSSLPVLLTQSPLFSKTALTPPPSHSGPIGSPSDGGSATPVGTLTNGGIDFNLFSGKNVQTGSTVYSFIVADGSLKNSYSGDLLPFFTYLEKFESGLSGMLLQSIQAGTEAVTGSATFDTSAYTISYS